MLKNISDKDLRLLVFMFLIVVVVGIGYWGIRPQIKAYINMQEEIEEQEATAELNDLKVMNMMMVSTMADEYEEQIAERKNEFYPMMKSSEVDQMMTAMAHDRNLEIFDLRFTMPTDPSTRMAYQYSKLYSEQKQAQAEYEREVMASLGLSEEDELLEENSSKKEEKEDKPSKKKKNKDEEVEVVTLDVFGEEDGYRPNTEIYAVPVTLTVGGTEAELHRFINEIIDSDKRILLISYSWGQYRNVVRRDAEGNIIKSELTEEELRNKKVLTIKLEVYMCDTSDVGEETKEEVAE